MSMKMPLWEGFFFGRRRGRGRRRGGRRGEGGDVDGVGGLVEAHGIGELSLEEVVIHDCCLRNNISEVILFFFGEGSEGGEVTTREEKGFERPRGPKGDNNNKRII